MRRGLRRLVVLAVAWTSAFAAPCRASEPPSELPFRDSILVERVLWPIRFESNKTIDPSPADCAVMTEEDLRVTEDGQRVTVTHLDTKAVRSIHAILIDTSHSMERNIAQAKGAAIRYARRTAPGEPVLVATFDDSLLLRTPLTRDGDALERSIRGIDLGDGTDLWSSVYHLIRTLEPQPERKVVVLLSDGRDTHGAKTDARAVARWFAGSTSDLAIYPIGLQIPDETGYVAPIAHAGLQMLADVTGGEFFVATTDLEVEESFDRIRAILDSKQYLTYIPPRFGEGPRDKPDEQPFRLRRVKVRTRFKAPCRAISLGSKLRFAGQRSLIPDAIRRLEPDETDDPAALVATCPGTEHGGDRPSIAYALPPDATPLLGDDLRSRLQLAPATRAIAGVVHDVARETGQLYDESLLGERGRFATGELTSLLSAARPVAVDAGSLEAVRDGVTSPLDVLVRLLRQRGCAPEGAAARKPPLLVNGATFLDLRRYLGQLLFDGFADFRAWASTRLSIELEDEAAAVLADLELAGYPEERRRAVREALLAAAFDPEPEQPQRLLAAWLGDVSIGRLAAELEAWSIGRLLAGDGADDPLVQDLERAWPRLRHWFPSPVRERVLVPLVLAYDAERDRFGFYRFVLPRFRFESPPLEPVPPAPLGYRTLRALLDESEVSPGWTVGAVDYRPLRSDELVAAARVLAAGGHPAAGRLDGVEVEIELRPPASDSSVRVAARYARGGATGDLHLVCREVDGADTPALASAGMAGWLTDAAPSCPRL